LAVKYKGTNPERVLHTQGPHAAGLGEQKNKLVRSRSFLRQKNLKIEGGGSSSDLPKEGKKHTPIAKHDLYKEEIQNFDTSYWAGE